jgi:hypothetical protein
MLDESGVYIGFMGSEVWCGLWIVDLAALGGYRWGLHQGRGRQYRAGID